MTKIHPEPVEIMTPIAEVPRVEAEASRNEEVSRTARGLQRPISREVLENLAYSVPKFDGKLEDWLIFRHFYMNRVHLVSAFTDTEKLLFLRHCVVGELGEQVARIGVSGANYSCAWAMIQGKFENKERELKAKHMSLLLELPEMGEESAEGLFFLIENTRKHLQALRMIGVKIPHDFVVVSLAKKLDPLTQFEWKIAAKDWEPTVEEMLEYLMGKVNFLVEIARIVEQKRQRGEEAAKCAFCNCPDHYLHQCFRFTEWPVEERIKWVENMGMCKKCFRDHYSAQCKFRACYKCHEEHNILLHQDPPLNAYPQVVIARRLANIHLNGANDEGTSDEGISESEESESSQEEKYVYRQESEAQIEHYIDHEGVFRGHNILSPEVNESEKLNGEIEDGAYQVDHNLVPPVAGIEEQSREIHNGVSHREESRMHPTATVQEEQSQETHKDAYQEDQIVDPPEVANPSNRNREYHENTCVGNNNVVPLEAVNQDEQPIEPQEDVCQSDQNAVPLEAADQEEQNMALHLGACHESQNLLPDEIDDEDEQEITIICQKGQNIEIHPVAYQEPTFEPQVDVCQHGGQDMLVPGMVYQQAQYVGPPEVAYQVDGQNVMPHAMVYPQVQYVVPHEEAYQVVEQNIPSPEVVYQPMQYMCAHVAPYQVDGQIIMPPGMIYQPEQYVVPPEEAYQQDEQNLVLPGVVYQPVQYIDPQLVDQDQGITSDPLMYSMPYYAAAQPLQQQHNILLPEQNVIQQQHAIQQQHVIQQQHALQQQHDIQRQHAIQHQRIIQQQHVIQQQHAIQQQHVIQQQHAIQHQVIQQQHAMQQQHIVQPHAIRHEQNRVPRQHVAHSVHQLPGVIQLEEAAANQEQNDQQQGEHSLQQEQNDGNQEEKDVQLAGRLRPDAEPFQPNGRDVVVTAPDGQVYIMSRLNYNAQEFVPQGGIQPLVDENEGEVKSKIKQYLSRVVAMLV